MYNILGTSWIEFGIFASTLRGICAKMVPNHSEDSLRFLRMAESLHSYPVVVCSHVHVCQSELVAEVCVFKGFLSAGEL